MVAECGTVTGAAEALHYTPSAVSQQLRTLAKDLGVELRRAGRAPDPAHRRPPARCSPTPTSCSAPGRRSAAEVAAAAGGRARAAAALRLLHRRRGAAAAGRRERPRRRARAAGCRSSRPTPRSASTCCSPTRPTWPWSSSTHRDLPPATDPPVRAAAPARGPARPARAGQPPAGRPAERRAGRRWSRRRGSWTAPAGRTTSCCRRPARRPASPRPWRTSAAEWDTGAALVAAGLGVALIPRLAHLPMGYPVARVPLGGDPTPHAPHPHRDPARQRRPAGRRAGARGARRDRRRGSRTRLADPAQSSDCTPASSWRAITIRCTWLVPS